MAAHVKLDMPEIELGRAGTDNAESPGYSLPVEAIIFIGVQATGKSSFYVERFLDSHLRLNMDMLRTRFREGILLRAFIEAKAKFVVDNTNPTRDERARYIEPAKKAHYRIVGYYFSSALAEAMERNAARAGRRRVPDAGVRGTYARLERPARDEGFDELFYVRLADGGGFAVEDWTE